MIGLASSDVATLSASAPIVIADQTAITILRHLFRTAKAAPSRQCEAT
jgi:hypothetical protein